MEATPERRAERNYEIGHSQGSFCMPRCKNTSDVFVAPVFTGCNETSNWKFLSAATSYARSPIVCTVHTQSLQSRFCCSVLPILFRVLLLLVTVRIHPREDNVRD